MIGATVSEIWRIRLFYTNDADKETIINDYEQFQLIGVKTTNPPYLAKVQENLQAPELTYKVATYCYDGHLFALNVRKSGDYWHFVIAS